MLWRAQNLPRPRPEIPSSRAPRCEPERTRRRRVRQVVIQRGYIWTSKAVVVSNGAKATSLQRTIPAEYQWPLYNRECLSDYGSDGRFPARRV